MTQATDNVVLVAYPTTQEAQVVLQDIASTMSEARRLDNGIFVLPSFVKILDNSNVSSKIRLGDILINFWLEERLQYIAVKSKTEKYGFVDTGFIDLINVLMPCLPSWALSEERIMFNRSRHYFDLPIIYYSVVHPDGYGINIAFHINDDRTRPGVLGFGLEERFYRIELTVKLPEVNGLTVTQRQITKSYDRLEHCPSIGWMHIRHPMGWTNDVDKLATIIAEKDTAEFFANYVEGFKADWFKAKKYLEKKAKKPLDFTNRVNQLISEDQFNAVEINSNAFEVAAANNNQCIAIVGEPSTFTKKIDFSGELTDLTWEQAQQLAELLGSFDK